MSEEQACDCAPILLIGFNRPDFMRMQIAAVGRWCLPEDLDVQTAEWK